MADTKTKAETYEAEIAPLVTQLRDLCKKHGMPVLITIQQEQREVSVGESMSYLRGEAWLDETTCPGMEAAYNCIMGAPIPQIIAVLAAGASRIEMTGTRH